MSLVNCYRSDLLSPCWVCNTPNPRMWKYLHPYKQRGEPNLYCWGVFCEKCRSYNVTEINKHEEIEDAIEAWNQRVAS